MHRKVVRVEVPRRFRGRWPSRRSQLQHTAPTSGDIAKDWRKIDERFTTDTRTAGRRGQLD